eukprot:1703093-Prymnesium_polylepis.1
MQVDLGRDATAVCAVIQWCVMCSVCQRSPRAMLGCAITVHPGPAGARAGGGRYHNAGSAPSQAVHRQRELLLVQPSVSIRVLLLDLCPDPFFWLHRGLCAEVLDGERNKVINVEHP